MQSPPTPRPAGGARRPIAVALTCALGAGFLVGVASHPETRGIGDLALVLLALLAGTALAYPMARGGPTRVVGGLTALGAAPSRRGAAAAASARCC